MFISTNSDYSSPVLHISSMYHSSIHPLPLPNYRVSSSLSHTSWHTFQLCLAAKPLALIHAWLPEFGTSIATFFRIFRIFFFVSRDSLSLAHTSKPECPTPCAPPSPCHTLMCALLTIESLRGGEFTSFFFITRFSFFLLSFLFLFGGLQGLLLLLLYLQPQLLLLLLFSRPPLYALFVYCCWFRPCPHTHAPSALGHVFFCLSFVHYQLKGQLQLHLLPHPPPPHSHCFTIHFVLQQFLRQTMLKACLAVELLSTLLWN